MNDDGIKEIYFVGNDNAHEVFTGPRNSFQGVVISFDKDFKFKVSATELTLSSIFLFMDALLS